MDLDAAATAFREFVATIQALRTPGTGCPWDLEQDHRTLRPYLVEETYEVLDAIDRSDDGALRDELGDLLLQVVLHAQVADDRGAFAITEVVRGITAKMVRRHPHVFGDVEVSGAAEVVRNWEQIKAAEKRAAGTEPTDPFTRIPEALPALLRAQRVAAKADQGLPAGALRQVQNRLAALEQDVKTVDDADQRDRLERGLGEVLFGLCQLASRLGVNAEDSLRDCTRRFVDDYRRGA